MTSNLCSRQTASGIRDELHIHACYIKAIDPDTGYPDERLKPEKDNSPKFGVKWREFFGILRAIG